MRPFTCGAALALALSAAAQAQLVITPAEPGLFIDISPSGTGTGIPLGLADDAEVDVPLTIFLGNLLVPAFSVLTVANNGGVGINTPVKDLSPINAPLPSSLAFGGGDAMLSFWDDPGSDFGDVYFEERLDLVIIQWDRDFDGDPVPPDDTGSWQIQIMAAPDQERCFAQYLYRDIQQPYPNGGEIATIGYQSGPGFNTVQWSFNQPGAVHNETVLSLCLIPAPGTAALLVLAAVAGRRRR